MFHRVGDLAADADADRIERRIKEFGGAEIADGHDAQLRRNRKAVVVAGVQGPRERIARHSRQRGEVEALFDDPAHFPVDPFQRHFAAGDFAVDQFGLHPVEPGVVQHAVDPVDDHAALRFAHQDGDFTVSGVV